LGIETWRGEGYESNNEDGAHVNLTIMDIPEDLLREFCEYVVKPFYEGGISEAII
jgi:hypothetical protein